MVSSEGCPAKPAAKRRKLLIVTTVAAVVVLALLITMVSGVWDSSDPAPSSSPGEVEDEERGSYIEIADPCGQMDLEGYQELVPIEIPAGEIQYEPGTQVEAAWQCKTEALQTDDAPGVFLLTGHVYATDEEAEREYEKLSDSGEAKWMDPGAAADEATADGDWERGVHAYAETDEEARSLQTIVQDGNLLLNLYFSLDGDMANDANREDLVQLENDTVTEVMVLATA